MRERQKLESLGLIAGGVAHDFNNLLVGIMGNSSLVLEFLPAKMVREISNLVRTSIPKSVDLKLHLDDELPSVHADPSQLQQLIMNLLINAAEAIGGNQSGTVRVTATLQDVENVYLQHNYASEPPIGVGRYIALEVNDTGCGIDEATRSRIFDPFFTTKFTGRGWDWLRLWALSVVTKVLSGFIVLPARVRLLKRCCDLARGAGDCFQRL